MSSQKIIYHTREEKKGIYSKIEKDTEYFDYRNVISISRDGYVVITENTDFDDELTTMLFKKYKKIRFHPVKYALPLVNWITEGGIPDYIINIVLDFGGWVKSYDVIPGKLPAGLKYLAIDNQNENDINLGAEVADDENQANFYEFNGSVANLPPALEELHINSRSFNQPLDNLPPTLRILVIKSPKFNQSIDYLPITLETFILDKINNYEGFNKIKLDNLPPGLKHLYIIDIYHKFSYVRELLPKSLVRISLPGYQFPKNLKDDD